jgi:ABC-type dipeptide/oligopeptide/nickel transport system ATPase subunit
VSDALLETRELHVHFDGRGGAPARAVDGVDLEVRRGEVLALVGESGCGKTTLARSIMGLERPAAGEISFEGEPLRYDGRFLRSYRSKVQMVFQDPMGALNPRQSVYEAVAEGLKELCISQEFVDAYGEYDDLPKTSRAGARITISGRVETPAEFGAVGIAKGPLPTELLASDLNSTSTYMMPTPYALYFPKGFVTPRPVAVENGRFTIDIALDRGAGRYAVSVWGKITPPDNGVGAGAPTRKDNELTMLSLRTIIVR